MYLINFNENISFMATTSYFLIEKIYVDAIIKIDNEN